MPLIRNTVVYVAVGFLPVAANFLLAPVYTSYLDPEEYALIGLATLFQTFLTFFLSFSLDSAFSRIYFDYEKEGRSKYNVLGSLMMAVTVISLMVFAILWFIGNGLFSLLLKIMLFRMLSLKLIMNWSFANTGCHTFITAWK